MWYVWWYVVGACFLFDFSPFFFFVTRLWPVHISFLLSRAAVALSKKVAKWHGVRACGSGCVGVLVLSSDDSSSVCAVPFRFLVSWEASLVEEVTARVTTFCLLIFSSGSRFLGKLVLGAGRGGWVGGTWKGSLRFLVSFGGCGLVEPPPT